MPVIALTSSMEKVENLYRYDRLVPAGYIPSIFGFAKKIPSDRSLLLGNLLNRLIDSLGSPHLRRSDFGNFSYQVIRNPILLNHKHNPNRPPLQRGQQGVLTRLHDRGFPVRIWYDAPVPSNKSPALAAGKFGGPPKSPNPPHVNPRKVYALQEGRQSWFILVGLLALLLMAVEKLYHFLNNLQAIIEAFL
jgi:hypothetical protein